MQGEDKQKQQVEIKQKIQNLNTKIQSDPYGQGQASLYEERSRQYSLLHQNKSAIADLSKSLYIEPSCEGYIKRGKLFASSEMFYYAFLDFEEAKKIYEEEKVQKRENLQKIRNAQTVKKSHQQQQRNTIKRDKNIDPEQQYFLQKSTVIVNIGELKKITKQYQRSKQFLPAELNNKFGDLITKMIEERMTKQIRSMKEHNQNYVQLLALVKKQQQKIKQLEENISARAIDYQAIFNKEMDQSTLSQANKQKCSVYFFTLISQMEKFYLSAKVLSQFDEKIAFEQYQQKYKQKILEKKAKSEGFYAKVVEKVFKLFEKHEDKIERIGQIIKQIPYVGIVFKLIKPSFKLCGAIEQIKLQSQCENILSSRPSVSSFNKLSSRVAYEMYKYFKINITTQTKNQKSSLYKRNYLESLASKFHKFKRNQMAAKVFKQIKPQEKDYAQEMGSTHASILMVGVAYGVFNFPRDSEFGESWQKQTFGEIEKIEHKMLNTEFEQEQILIESEQKGNQKSCRIF